MMQARGILSLLVLTLASSIHAFNKVAQFESLSTSEMCELIPLDTSFLRPKTCNYWVRCPANNISQVEEGTCATGLYYNKELGRCALEGNVVCSYAQDLAQIAPNANSCVNETDGTFLEDKASSDCSGYVLCKGHQEVKAKCPNNLIFNPQSRSCVYSTNYKCPKTGGKTTSPACRALANNTRLANEEHCHQYYICLNGVLHERECANQMAYDVALGRCVTALSATCYATAKLPPPENTFCLFNNTARIGYFADDESCSHYYICDRPVNGKHDTQPKHMACDQGKYYDDEKLSCRDRLNVRCMQDRCAGTSLTYVNVWGDCQSYARCSEGVTVGSGRCPSNYFFDERSQGCTPVNHSYVACTV